MNEPFCSFLIVAIVFWSYLKMIKLTEYFSLLLLIDYASQMFAYEKRILVLVKNFGLLWDIIFSSHWLLVFDFPLL